MASIDRHAATAARLEVMPECALNHIATVVTLGGVFNDPYFHVPDLKAVEFALLQKDQRRPTVVLDTSFRGCGMIYRLPSSTGF